MRPPVDAVATVVMKAVLLAASGMIDVEGVGVICGGGGRGE